MTKLYDFEVESIDGQKQNLQVYKCHVLLIVNVASRCGFTPQYAGLEAMYRRYRGQNFTILGFPCNQFGHQEPGNETEIQRFCNMTYDVTFPMFARIRVNGPSAHPLYRHLKATCRGLLGTKSIKWNFTKFLIDRQGHVVRRFAPMVAAEQIEPELQRLLAEAPAYPLAAHQN